MAYRGRGVNTQDLEALHSEDAEVIRVLKEFHLRSVALAREVVRTRAEVARLSQACSRQNNEIEQTLGQALGYPWYKDDLKNFPGATEADGVCVGEHVAETLAAEAVGRLQAVEQERARLERIVLEQQDGMKRLEVKNDRLTVELAERGRVNADLNKRLQRAEKAARQAGSDQDA
jgi:hypothetical protein